MDMQVLRGSQMKLNRFGVVSDEHGWWPAYAKMLREVGAKPFGLVVETKEELKERAERKKRRERNWGFSGRKVEDNRRYAERGRSERFRIGFKSALAALGDNTTVKHVGHGASGNSYCACVTRQRVRALARNMARGRMR